MKYFKGLNTLKDIKAMYHKLAKENHPDVGGDTATMQEINNEYAEAIKWISIHGEGKEKQEAAAEVPAEYMNAVNAAVGFENLIVELVGSWIWVTGNTYEAKEALKAAGYYWASKKKAWYWRPEWAACKGGKKSLEEIKEKYGSTKISGTSRVAIAG